MKRTIILITFSLFSILFAVGCSTTSTPSPGSTSSPPSTSPSPSTKASIAAITTPASTVPSIATTTSASKPSTPPATTPVSTQASKYGGILRWIAGSGPGAPMGAPWLSNGTSVFGMQFAEQFLLKEMQDGSLLPNLASSYDVNNDPANPSITLHLVKGVKFQDGTDFNAKAVKWNLDKQMAPGSTNIGSTTAWKSIEVLDDYTLRINLKTWQNTALVSFGNGVAYQVSPTAFEKNGADWMNYNMVGTGPFIQKEFQRDVTLTFTKNPNYWEQGKPYLDGIQLLYVTDTMTQEALFKSGGAEVLQCANDFMASRMQAAGFKVIAQPATGATLVPDSANPDSPWSKLKVRQAAEYAIDKESIVKTFGYGFQTPAYQIVYSNSPAYDPSLVSQYRTYNVAKAKQLLSEAGYPNGFKTTIIVSPLGTSNEIALALQAYLAAVGIQCELQYPQAGAFAQIQTGTWRNGIIYGPFLQYANPNSAFRSFAPGSAWFQSLKRPDGFGDLYTTSVNTAQIDPSLVKKLTAAMFNDSTEIFLSFGSQEIAVTDKVHDAGLGTRGNWGWFEPQDTWLTK